MCVRIIWNTPMHMHTSFSTLVFTRHWVENINWRQSVPRLQGLEEGLGSESWLSSQEVLFLTALHKHWKRDPKKMSQTHYFHCKHADIHILYCSLSLSISLISVSSLSRSEGYIFSQRGIQYAWVCDPEIQISCFNSWMLACYFLVLCKVLTVYMSTNNKEPETKTL